MTSRTCRRGLIAFTLLCVCGRPTAAVQQSRTAEISGVVVDAASGRPIPGATVTIVGAPAEQTGQTGDDRNFFFLLPSGTTRASVLTDANGAFRIDGLSDGAFDVTASRAGWISGSIGQRQWNDGEQWMSIGAQQKIAGTRLLMWRAPQISGRVTDAYGQPVVGVDVEAFTTRINPYGIPLEREGGTTTDDRGAYAFVVTPGEHIISVNINSADAAALPPPPRGLTGRRAAYASTFYPGVRLATAGTTVVTQPGADRDNIDIRVLSAEVFRVSVSVTPAPKTNYGMTAWIGGVGTTWVDVKGRATFSNVPAGPTILTVSTPELITMEGSRLAPLMTMRPPLLRARMSLTVDADLDVPVVLRESARFSGRVVFDGVSPMSVERLIREPLALESASGQVAGVGMYAPDGTFSTEQLSPGTYLFRPRTPEGWQLKSVVAAGRDVTDVGLVLDNTDVGDIVMTITDTQSSIKGHVSADMSLATTHAWVLVFPDDTSIWQEQRFRRRTSLVYCGTSGNYSTDLPPGGYFVVAIDSRPKMTAEHFARLAGIATRVQIGGGQVASQDLRMQRMPR